MIEPFTNTDSAADDAFDKITFAFMDEWEQGDATGTRPALGDYLTRYPQYAAQLTDFVLDFVRFERGGAIDYTAPLSTPLIRAGERVRESLGLPQYLPEAPPSQTFAELMKESGVKLVTLSKTLGVPALFLNQIQRGLLTDWSGALVNRFAAALNRSVDEINAALHTSRATGGSLAGAHFRAQNGDPDTKAVEGTPQSLAEMLNALPLSPDERAAWLADE